MRQLLTDATRRLPLALIVQRRESKSSLRPTLGFWHLTAIGLGGIIGVGIFVLTGVVAATQAGPAVALSFLIAGVASGAAALCYAEFAGMFPGAGSAYLYTYIALGELAAFLIGWVLLLEYSLIVSVVAIGWAGYVRALFEAVGPAMPVWASGAPGTGRGHGVNLLAVLGALGTALLLTYQIQVGARLNSVMVIIKIAAILILIVAGITFVKPENWHPFMPYGFDGVVTGAAVVFFAVFGFEALTTASEESLNPQRDVPRAVVVSLGIAMALYIGFCLVLTGMAHYTTLNTEAPVAAAFRAVGMNQVGVVISIAAVVGITTAMIAFMFSCVRVAFAISRDGLLPRFLSRVDPHARVPRVATWLIGSVTACAAGFLPLTELAKLVNAGVLCAFILVCGAVIVMRRAQPGLPRSFRSPWVPAVPLLGIGFACWLLAHLSATTWIAFLAWLGIGFLVYILYARNRSALRKINLLALTFVAGLALSPDVVVAAELRARDLGVPFEGEPGCWNAITDVQPLEVGHQTLNYDERDATGAVVAVRTGVTAIHPLGKRLHAGGSCGTHHDQRHWRMDGNRRGR